MDILNSQGGFETYLFSRPSLNSEWDCPSSAGTAKRFVRVRPNVFTFFAAPQKRVAVKTSSDLCMGPRYVGQGPVSPVSHGHAMGCGRKT